ncbi:hypothetical protein C8R45DRAFT_1171832 [Mycena sanguinolenta]|nr:hypothetical protein C8R45DRAFT_1171832 [Mycena sanguinolenta]
MDKISTISGRKKSRAPGAWHLDAPCRPLAALGGTDVTPPGYWVTPLMAALLSRCRPHISFSSGSPGSSGTGALTIKYEREEITTHLSKTDTARSGDLPTRPDPSCHGVTRSSLLPPSSPPATSSTLTNAQTARRGVGRRTGEVCGCETRHGQQSGSVAGPLTSYGSELYQDDGYNRSSSTILCRCSTRDSLLTALEDSSPAPTGAGTDGARQFQGGNSGAHGLTAASHRAPRAPERAVVSAINSALHASFLAH